MESKQGHNKIFTIPGKEYIILVIKAMYLDRQTVSTEELVSGVCSIRKEQTLFITMGDKSMTFFQRFYLDREKDIAVDLFMEEARLFYVIRTPNHHTGNLIRNMAKLFSLETVEDESGLLTIRDEIPCYYDGYNRKMYILRLGNTKVANIFPDGTVELKASIPAISKTLMSQTKDYRLSEEKTIVKTYIRSDCKFSADLHTHMNGNLPPDILIALGIVHQVRYPYLYQETESALYNGTAHKA